MVDKGDILNALRAVASDDQPLHLPLAIGDHLDRRHVRPAHVREAFADRDAAVLLRHEDAELALMTKAVGGIARPFVWLVVLARAMDQWQVSHALRLYGDDNARAAWQADPVEAFADALDRWDIDFTSGAQPVRFMPYRRITASPQNFGTVISALGLPEGWAFDFVQTFKVSGPQMELAWVYFIDKQAYEADFRSGRH